ncbi:MAG: hypothetical protein JHC61_06640 [Burkholderiaceae bacterium]|nr:hypothetical protein [Burkholderiaceae bacterium]
MLLETKSKAGDSARHTKIRMSQYQSSRYYLLVLYWNDISFGRVKNSDEPLYRDRPHVKSKRLFLLFSFALTPVVWAFDPPDVVYRVDTQAPDVIAEMQGM